MVSHFGSPGPAPEPSKSFPRTSRLFCLSAPIFVLMSVARELQRRIHADKSERRFEPCLPRLAKQPPAGPGWIHEIKHDGFRIIAHRDAGGVRLVTRKGFDLADRFILAATALASLPARSCVIDGEAIACDQRGLSVFDMIRWRQHDNAVTPALSICLSSMARICDANRSRFAKLLSKDYCAAPDRASRSIAISKTTALSFTNRPARLAARVLCPSGSARRIDRAARRTG